SPTDRSRSSPGVTRTAAVDPKRTFGALSVSADLCNRFAPVFCTENAQRIQGPDLGACFLNNNVQPCSTVSKTTGDTSIMCGVNFDDEDSQLLDSPSVNLNRLCASHHGNNRSGNAPRL